MRQGIVLFCGLCLASSASGVEVVAAVPLSKIREIAETKMSDLNAADVEGAMRIIEGTARSMGIQIAAER